MSYKNRDDRLANDRKRWQTPEYKAYQREYNLHRRRPAQTLVPAARSQPCTDCGLVDPAIIEFDHVPERGPRLFSISSTSWTGKKRLLEELAKCDPVCPNCHAHRTISRRKGTA